MQQWLLHCRTCAHRPILKVLQVGGAKSLSLCKAQRLYSHPSWTRAPADIRSCLDRLSAKLHRSQHCSHNGVARDSVLAPESLTQAVLQRLLVIYRDGVPAPICSLDCHLIQGKLPCYARVVSVCLDGVVVVCVRR